MAGVQPLAQICWEVIPMSRAKLIEMAKRNLVHVKAGTVDQAPGAIDVFDTARLERDGWLHETAGWFEVLDEWSELL